MSGGTHARDDGGLGARRDDGGLVRLYDGGERDGRAQGGPYPLLLHDQCAPRARLETDKCMRLQCGQGGMRTVDSDHHRGHQRGDDEHGAPQGDCGQRNDLGRPVHGEDSEENPRLRLHGRQRQPTDQGDEDNPPAATAHEEEGHVKGSQCGRESGTWHGLGPCASLVSRVLSERASGGSDSRKRTTPLRTQVNQPTAAE